MLHWMLLFSSLRDALLSNNFLHTGFTSLLLSDPEDTAMNWTQDPGLPSLVEYEIGSHCVCDQCWARRKHQDLDTTAQRRLLNLPTGHQGRLPGGGGTLKFRIEG